MISHPMDTLRGAAEAREWFAGHTLSAGQLPGAATVAERKRAAGLTVSVALPALNEEATVGDICRAVRLGLMEEVPLVDQLVVLDGHSTDGTAGAARREGATVLALDQILPEIQPVRGKGEAMWRSLAVLSGDIVVWIDADIRNFRPHFVSRLVAPLVSDPDVSFVKGYYRRPFDCAGEVLPSGGGRVTELLARPLLSTFFPELGGFIQPLAGEYAGRREVLSQVGFLTGYSVEIGLLIDLAQVVGLRGMVQVDLEERVHRNRPLEELGPMAHAIARTILRRAEECMRLKPLAEVSLAPLLVPGPDGVDERQAHEIERPPMSLVPVYLDALRSRESAAMSSATNGPVVRPG